MKTHRIFFKLLPLFVLCLACGLASPAGAAETTVKTEVTELAPVTLEQWRDSNDQNRYAFLVGFATMLQLEKEWQGRNDPALLPFKQSLVGSWVNGLSGVTLKQIHDSTNDYIAKNPQDLKRPLIDFLWYTYAQPPIDARRGSR